MLKPLAILLLFVSPVGLGQQSPAKSPTPPRPICTLVPKGKLVKFVKPVYPAEVSAKAIAEGVTVKVTIDKQGVPKDLQITEGGPVLAQSALKALRQWRWKPYLLNGEPVEVESTVYIKFDPLIK
jgi:protein TonB